MAILAMDTMDTTVVAVSSYAALKDVLEDVNSAYGDVTTVFLAADIQMAGGIDMKPSRTSLTLNGKDPFDPSGNTIHRITDYHSAASAGTLGVRAASSVAVTYRNIHWTGNNPYGIFFTPEAAATSDVVVSFEHIVYNGPRMVHHPNGVTRFSDCTVNIVQPVSGIPPNSAATLHQAEFAGSSTVTQMANTPASAVFQMRGAAPSFSVQPDAALTIRTAQNVFSAEEASLALTVGPNATLHIESRLGLCRANFPQFSSVLIDSGASFTLLQAEAYGTYPTLSCEGSFTVNPNARVYMQANYTGGGSLIHFAGTSSTMNFDRPKSFVLYSLDALVMTFAAQTAVSIITKRMHTWTVPKPLELAGKMEDASEFSFRRTTGVDLQLAGTTTSTETTVTEMVTGRPIPSLKLYNLRVLSMGFIYLAVEEIKDDGVPITGTTEPNCEVRANWATIHTVDGAADAAGNFSLETGAIPAGTAVRVSSHIPFITVIEILLCLESEELTLQTPSELRFLLNPVATQPVVLYGCADPAWSLTVLDTRAHSSVWYLYAAISGPLTSAEDPAHTLPGALVFVDDANLITPLSSTPLLIYTGESNAGVSKTTVISWVSTKGVLLRCVALPYYSGETYSAKISWTLTTTML